MVEAVETRYAKSGRVHIAYQVFGDGAVDVVFDKGWSYSVEQLWERPAAATLLDGLGSFARLILFDHRGTGMSDPVSMDTMASLDQWLDDLLVVLDAAASTNPVLMATDAAGPLGILFAATFPERTSGLVLVNSFARITSAPDYPCGMPPERWDEFVERWEQGWGTVEMARFLVRKGAPPAELDEAACGMRRASSPGVTSAVMRMMGGIDVRPLLPSIQAPTLVLHARENRMYLACHSRYLAEHIPNARFRERPGAFLPTEPDAELWLVEVEEFLTGARTSVDRNRALLTILFTDVVGSTTLASELGDRQWVRLLNDHDRAVRSELARFRGQEVNTTGDGFVASFDGPARAIQCAVAIGKATEQIGVPVRTGLHTGECEIRGNDLSGLAVHIAARVAAYAEPGEVLVSRTVKDLVAGSGLRFQERGPHALKGVPDKWDLFAVSSP